LKRSRFHAGVFVFGLRKANEHLTLSTPAEKSSRARLKILACDGVRA